MHPGLRALITWPYIVFLAILITNDALLKAHYPGLITGKLSDFAGIAIVTLPLLATWPRRYYAVAAIVSVCFLWWKSPASGPFIEWVNATHMLRIARVVDYTDLFALAIIPLCKHIAFNLEKFPIPAPNVRRLATIPIALLTLAAILGTSQAPFIREAELLSKPGSSGIDARRVSQIIAKLAVEDGLKCEDCSRLPDRATYRGEDFEFRYSVVDASRLALEVSVRRPAPPPLFGRSNAERGEEFIAKIKSALSREYSSLTYIEKLP